MRKKTNSANVASRILLELKKFFARGRCEAEGSDGSCLEPQPVADVMEAQRMGELDKVYRAEVAEHGE